MKHAITIPVVYSETELLMLRLTLALLLSFSLTSEVLAEPVRLGLIVPLTGSASLMGESLRGVVEVARLKSLVPVFEDDQCEGKQAISAYLKLRSTGVRVFYMACSGSILATAPLARKNGDLILSTYAGSARIRASGAEVIRLNPDAVSIAEALAAKISGDMRPVAILHEEQEYAASLADRLVQRLGPDLKINSSYRPDASSFSSEILSIKRAGVKSLVFIPLADRSAQTILKQLSLNKISLPVIGEVNLCDYPFSPAEFGLHGFCVSARFEGPAYQSFLADYASVLKRPPAYPFYDAMALDLFTHLDKLSATGTASVADIKDEILKGFSGKFSEYRLSAEGEPLSAGDYLKVLSY